MDAVIPTYEQFILERHKHIKLMYHGSSALVKDKLQPRASNVLEGEAAVFATPDKWLALVFIPKWSDNDMELSVVNGKGVLTELKANAFDLLKCPGYLYSLAAGQFGGDDRLGMQGSEFICRKPVHIRDTQYIFNVLHEMEKLPGKLVRHKNSD